MKKSKKNTGLITGLIVGGAVVSVAAMLAAKQKRGDLPENLQTPIEKPLGFWKRLFYLLIRKK